MPETTFTKFIIQIICFDRKSIIIKQIHRVSIIKLSKYFIKGKYISEIIFDHLGKVDNEANLPPKPF